MKLYTVKHHFILLPMLVTSGGCWLMLEDEYGLDLKLTREPHPMNSSGTNSSAITARTITLSNKVNNTLAGFVLFLTVVTYGFLMRYTTILSNESILPSKFLEDNLTAILSSTWPEKYFGSLAQSVVNDSDSWVLFNIEKIGVWNQETKQYLHEARGSQEVQDQRTAKQPGKSLMIKVKMFSPIMKSLVQIAIWDSVSFWLVLVMFANTMLYNGFVSHNITNDSIIRLLLVSVYAITNFGHQYRAGTLLYRNFTFMLFQTCWTIICRDFVFQEYSEYEFGIMAMTRDGLRYTDYGHIFCRSLSADLFGMTERFRTYRIEDSDHLPTHYREIHIPGNDKRRGGPLLNAMEKTESKFDKFVQPLREAEIKLYEKATESALEKTHANVAVLFSICLATAVAPWTSIQTINATNAQLGSYALLLSISSGLLALVGSITQLTNATDSAETLLRIQENTIGAPHEAHEHEDPSGLFWVRDKPRFGLSRRVAGKVSLTSFGLWRSTSVPGKLFCLLFGSALILVPRFHRNPQAFDTVAQGRLLFKIRDDAFGCDSRSGSAFPRIFRCVEEKLPPILKGVTRVGFNWISIACIH